MTDDAAVIRRGRGRAGLAAIARAVPVWVWLVGLVVVSTLIRYAIGRRAVAPWIMVDELIYSELAKSFAATGHFLVRDQPSDVYGFVYPLLISPAWAIFEKVPDAYAAAKAINALLMSLAAVPAYVLARRVLGPWLSLAAAVLTVSVPSLVYTGTLMTENAFYPVFVLVALTMVLWLERPTVLWTVLLIAACVLAYLTRTQAIALLPAVLTAPLLLSGRRAFREYRLLYGLAGAGVLLVVVVQAARGASPLGVLGAYEAARNSHYSVGEVARWFLDHVAELDLSLGVLPFAAFVLLALVSRRLQRPDRVFLAASVALSFWLVLEVAIFASQASVNRIEERNMFYVAPLFLIALLVWIDRGLPRPSVATTVAVAVAAALPGALPYADLIGLSAVSDTIALLPLWTLSDSGIGLQNIGLVVVCASILAGLLFLVVPRRYALVLPLLVLAYFAISQKPIEGKQRTASIGSLFAGITVPQRDWIDRAVGPHADVVAIWSGNTDRYAIWENEIFNRSVGTIYDTGEPLAGDLPETPLRTDRLTGLMRTSNGKPVRAAYVLTDGTVSLQGRVVARDERKGMLLYAVHGPLRQTTRVEGLYPQDTWSGRTVTYTRLSCRGGTVTVELQSDPALFPKPNTVTATAGGRVVGRVAVAPRATRILRVPLTPRRGTCAVRFTVGRTAVPAVVTSGANADPRALGIHFNRFAYTP
jgi:hypothetical protein